jgi:hypothetical protein
LPHWEFGLRARRHYIGFPLTRARRTRRMIWLAAHGSRQFPMRQWRRVFFTDESRFTLFRPDGRRRVYRRRGERLLCIWRENLDKLWLHGTGRYPTGKLSDAVAQMELQPAGGFHPYILRLLNYRLSQSTATLTPETALTTVGNHNRHIHPKTERNRLCEFGLRARRHYIGFPLGNCLEPCAANQIIRRVRRARVRGKPM